MSAQEGSPEQDVADLNGEAIMIARQYFSEACGLTTSFFDDSARVISVLASRAILAGLHQDIKNPITRNLMEMAAEKLRETHEKELGFAISPLNPQHQRAPEDA